MVSSTVRAVQAIASHDDYDDDIADQDGNESAEEGTKANQSRATDTPILAELMLPDSVSFLKKNPLQKSW